MTVIELGQHPDESDRATEFEMAMTETAIRERQHLTKQQQTPDETGTYAILQCVECDEDIGIGRLKAAAKNTLCIYCATALEKRK